MKILALLLAITLQAKIEKKESVKYIIKSLPDYFKLRVENKFFISFGILIEKNYGSIIPQIHLQKKFFLNIFIVSLNLTKEYKNKSGIGLNWQFNDEKNNLYILFTRTGFTIGMNARIFSMPFFDVYVETTLRDSYIETNSYEDEERLPREAGSPPPVQRGTYDGQAQHQGRAFRAFRDTPEDERDGPGQPVRARRWPHGDHSPPPPPSGWSRYLPNYLRNLLYRQ